jgi:hypothetical protein
VDWPTPDDAPVMSTTRGLGMSDLHTLGSVDCLLHQLIHSFRLSQAGSTGCRSAESA